MAHWPPTFTVNSANQITVTVPAGGTSGYLTVVTPIGLGVSTGVYTYIAPPVPTIYEHQPDQRAYRYAGYHHG